MVPRGRIELPTQGFSVIPKMEQGNFIKKPCSKTFINLEKTIKTLI